jgi:glutathione S-transferase
VRISVAILLIVSHTIFFSYSSSSMIVLQGCKLTYFDVPARGEATRLALTIGNVKFTDERITFPQWKELKPTTPWGSLPVLTLSDGMKIGQQHAILRFVGKETDLYPTDSVAAAKVDSLIGAVEEINAKTTAVGRGLAQEEKEAARKEACQEGGAVYGVLDKIDKFIAANGMGGHAVGGSMTVADLFVYATCNTLVSGHFDGVPLDSLDGFANIMACRKVVRSHPAVTKWYDELDAKVPASYGPL